MKNRKIKKKKRRKKDIFEEVFIFLKWPKSTKYRKTENVTMYSEMAF